MNKNDISPLDRYLKGCQECCGDKTLFEIDLKDLPCDQCRDTHKRLMGAIARPEWLDKARLRQDDEIGIKISSLLFCIRNSANNADNARKKEKAEQALGTAYEILNYTVTLLETMIESIART